MEEKFKGLSYGEVWDMLDNCKNPDKKNGYQINCTFGVEFDNEPNNDGSPIGEHKYSTGFWFYTHHSKDKQKLVIHTIQLSQIQNEMINKMAEVIRDHLQSLVYLVTKNNG